MKYKKGDKLVCINNVINILGSPLFIRGETYTILHISQDEEDIILDHILYANEYGDFSEKFVDKNFINLKESRKLKLQKINNI